MIYTSCIRGRRRDARRPRWARWCVPVFLLALVVLLAAGVSGRAQAGTPSAYRSPCSVTELTGTFTAIPFSEGAGQIYYELTITNVSPVPCVLTSPSKMRLLGAHHKPLPTHARTRPSGRYTVVLAGGQWAQAQAKFTPDVTAAGENAQHCEPDAHALQLTLDDGAMLAFMDPTPVCQYGAMYFTRLAAVAQMPACAPNAFTASLKSNGGGPQYVSYTLTLQNLSASPCHTNGNVVLTLLDTSGHKMPQKASTGLNAPYVIPGLSRVMAVATFYSKSGPREPKRGPCEPKATTVRINLRPGLLFSPVSPPFSACHKGAYTLTSLSPQ